MEKLKFKSELYRFAEGMVTKRRKQMRQRHLDELKHRCSSAMTYQETNRFLEDSIERDIKFLDQWGAGCDTQMLQLKKLMKGIK